MPVQTVYDAKEILLQDGKSVVLKPLPLGLLKKLMDSWKKVGDAKEEDDIFEVYIQCAGICLSREFKEEFEKPINVDGILSDDYRDHLYDTLDVPTIYEILDVCGGLKLNDPNLAEALEMAQQEETPGTT